VVALHTSQGHDRGEQVRNVKSLRAGNSLQRVGMYLRAYSHLVLQHAIGFSVSREEAFPSRPTLQVREIKVPDQAGGLNIYAWLKH